MSFQMLHENSESLNLKNEIFQKKSDSLKSSCTWRNGEIHELYMKHHENPLFSNKCFHPWAEEAPFFEMVTPAYHPLLGIALFWKGWLWFRHFNQSVQPSESLDLCRFLSSTKWPGNTGNASSAACKARSGLSRANRILKVAFSMTWKTTDTWDWFFLQNKMV